MTTRDRSPGARPAQDGFDGHGLANLTRLVRTHDLIPRLRDTQLFHVDGVRGCAGAWLGHHLHQQTRQPLVYVAANAERALMAAADLSFFSRQWPGKVPDATQRIVLAPESAPYAQVQADRQLAMQRLATLAALAAKQPCAHLVTSAAALVRRVLPASVVRMSTRTLRPGTEIDLASLAQHWLSAGYLRVPVVEDPGCFTVRGGILDIWPPGRSLPLRAELFGDEITSLKSFNPNTQRTGEPLAEALLPPARDVILNQEFEDRARQRMRELADAMHYPSSKTRRLLDELTSARASFGIDGYLPAFYELAPLLSYVPAAAHVVIEDPAQVIRAIRTEHERILLAYEAHPNTPQFAPEELLINPNELARDLQQRHVVALHPSGIRRSTPADFLEALEFIPSDAPNLATRDQEQLERAGQAARGAKGRAGVLGPLLERLQDWGETGQKVVISARSEVQAERARQLLSHRGIDLPTAASDEAPARIVVGNLARGMIAPGEGIVLVTEEEVFGRRAHRKPQSRRRTRADLDDLRALAPGDHVVHVEHGIGRYLGMERRTLAGGTSVDLLVVEYSGGDKLFVPVYRLNQVQKFSGGEGTPRLDRLGGHTFAKTKARIKKRVREMADELLKLYAERAQAQKRPLPPPDDDYAAFEAAFPFEETPDQAAAIADVMKDIGDSQVMDRLVCGDVGFGKTEVALRAAYRYAMDGRQVALLCPTTVLAQQHHLTFQRRFADYPLSVHVLSRFQSKRALGQTLKAISNGSADIVIGTHRLLSKDVHFKALGLLVVDEEQRFGVVHKERIKQLRTHVDVLTLSATPIPRTLQLAVGGLREMSVISTAPVDRRAIRTISARFDEEIVREAIERELSRGGQVFYVYNRIADLHERAARVKTLVPAARIAVGHGQMKESALEKTMLDFVEGRYDVLVTTAIVESGLDIPRANTMIVDRADLFGLAQLYQLRGRIGRSRERAYCYLLVPPPSTLSDEARQRIDALMRYTELGSGFHIASLDMQLRGAGNLLGAEQSGTVASVGFDLFCQMLEEATHELKGEPVVHEVDPDVTVDAEALLPDDYVEEVGVRLSLYKRLASALSEDEVMDLAKEIEDRFGRPPPAAQRLFEMMRLKTDLRRLRVLVCEATHQRVSLRFREDTPLSSAAVLGLVRERPEVYRLTPDMRLTRRVDTSERFADGLGLADRMLRELGQLVSG